MGKPVASYLTQEGVLHRGKASLDLLEKEELAEFEILRYDEEQFRDAMIICDNRGLLLTEEKGATAVAPSQSREAKPREEENVLSAMMKRFAAPKIGEKQEPAREAPKAEGENTDGGAKGGEGGTRDCPNLFPPSRKIRWPRSLEKKEGPVSPPQETETLGHHQAPQGIGQDRERTGPGEVKAEDITPKAGVPEPEWKAKAAELAVSQVQRPPAAVEQKPPVEQAGPREAGPKVPEGQCTGGPCQG